MIRDMLYLWVSLLTHTGFMGKTTFGNSACGVIFPQQTMKTKVISVPVAIVSGTATPELT